jgi:hypothetical protein
MYPNLISGLALWLVPIIISTCSLPFLSNCAYGDGVLFYLEVALPTTILAVAFGTAIGWLTRSKRAAVLLFIAFWLVSFIISLLPGYIFPQLFTYGWQYGFFPGLVWDEYITLGAGYKWHLLEWVSLAVIMLQLAPKRNKAIAIGAFVLYVMLLFTRDEHRIVTTHAQLREQLSATIKVDSNTSIHYRAASLTAAEAELLRRNTQWYLYDIRQRLALRDSTEKITIYLYPSTESLYQYVGTRNASIAKPWLSELHIAKENLGSLKHELVHVLLREWGSFPFNASWSTAITEGVAMALEPTYDGLHTLDEHSSAIIHMKLADGVRNVMGFAGFASQATTSSYVLSGSFVSYLLWKYGPEKLSNVYRTLDFKAAYGLDLRSLEQRWLNVITPIKAKMDHSDSLRTRFYFDRASILFTPCLRRMGKLEYEARIAMQAKDYETAKSRFLAVYNESGRISALRGALTAAKYLDDYSVIPLLKKKSIAEHPQRASLFMLRAELSDTLYYDSLIDLQLSDQNLLIAYARKYSRDREGFLSWSRRMQAGVGYPFYYESEDWPHNQQFADKVLEAEAYMDEGLLSLAGRSYYEGINRLDFNSPYPEEFMLLGEFRSMQLGVGSYIPFNFGPLSAGMEAEYSELTRKIAFWNSGRSTYPNASVQ